MLLFLEEIEEALADFRSGHGDGGDRWSVAAIGADKGRWGQSKVSVAQAIEQILPGFRLLSVGKQGCTGCELLFQQGVKLQAIGCFF